MRKLFGILAAGALMLGGSLAQAAPVQTTANLRVDLGFLGAFTVTGAGTVDVSGSGGSIMATTTGGAVISDATRVAVPGGLVNLATTTTVDLTPNQNTLVSKIILNPGVGNATGTFNSGFVPTAAEQCPAQGNNEACVVGGGKGGIMPILGTVTAFVPDGTGVFVSLALLGLGGGGGGSVGIISAEGAPFTTGVGQAAILSPNLDGTSVFSITGSGADPITFVTPVAIDILAVGLVGSAGFSLSGIKMVPEPGTLLLLASGVAGLAIAGRRRR